MSTFDEHKSVAEGRSNLLKLAYLGSSNPVLRNIAAGAITDERLLNEAARAQPAVADVVSNQTRELRRQQKEGLTTDF